MSSSIAALQLPEDDVQRMLACQVHIGSRNIIPQMNGYVYARRPDGVHLLHLARTWEKIQLAARVIVAVENPAEVVVVSARPFGQRAALKFAHYTGATALAGRYTPGTFTNQVQKRFIEPRLLIVMDPRTDHQPLTESSYVNVPTIALCDCDSPMKFVDVAIPCNNKGRLAIGMVCWLLAREVLRLRGDIVRSVPWEVKPDLFFYREPEEAEAARAAAAAAAEAGAAEEAGAVEDEAANNADEWAAEVEANWTEPTGAEASSWAETEAQ